MAPVCRTQKCADLEFNKLIYIKVIRVNDYDLASHNDYVANKGRLVNNCQCFIS